MGRSERRMLVSLLTVLLMHLLRWRYQPTHRGSSWRISIANARDDLADYLADNPGLRTQLDEAVAGTYCRAKRQAVLETRLDTDMFSETCPFASAEAMHGDFWPG